MVNHDFSTLVRSLDVRVTSVHRDIHPADEAAKASEEARSSNESRTSVGAGNGGE